MAATSELNADDVRKTYRYLRIGMIGAVVLLAVSIGIEVNKADCLQTSISAYYYTPVEAIFIGFLIALALALIVYKGRSAWEDFFLNIAGILAPVVAVAPTTDVGRCWSVPPIKFPVREDGTLANWVVTNIENNIYAVLAIGLFAVVVMIITATKDARPDAELGQRLRKDGSGRQQAMEENNAERRKRVREIWGPPIVSLVLLIGGWLAIAFWDDFNTRAHGVAALILIACLGFAIIAQANFLRPEKGVPWSERNKRLVWIYGGIVALMALGGTFIWLTRVFEDHTVFALEAWEIGLFAVYWIFETIGKWDEEVRHLGPSSPGSAV
jgi:hypothetical protein